MQDDERPHWAKRLQDERAARGWSKPAMARALFKVADLRPTRKQVESLARQIRKYENGENFPRDWSAAYAAAFGLPERMLFAETVNASITRRDALLLATAGAALPLRRQDTVAPELVGYFRSQLPGHYSADMWLGPHMLIPTVAAQTTLIRHLLRSAETPVRRGLLEMGVAYAALLGWLYQDAADLGHSAHWREAALDMAHRSGDPELVGYALANKAMHAVDLHDGAAVVDYAEAALGAEDRLCPKVRVLALVHLGHGRSLLRDRRGADEAMDQAEALIPHIDDEYLWANACRRTPQYMTIQRATAYGRAGAYEDAAPLWDEVLGGQPEDFRRDTGVFWARQASALAAARRPDPERVVRIASIAATACDATGSERLRGELAALPAHASTWTASTRGRELTEIIASIT